MIHSKFNSCFYFAQPNIFQFINVFKEIQIESCIKLQTTEKAQNLISKNKEIYIKTEMDKYKNNTITYPNNTLISSNKKRN